MYTYTHLCVYTPHTRVYKCTCSYLAYVSRPYFMRGRSFSFPLVLPRRCLRTDPLDAALVAEHAHAPPPPPPRKIRPPPPPLTTPPPPHTPANTPLGKTKINRTWRCVWRGCSQQLGAKCVSLRGKGPQASSKSCKDHTRCAARLSPGDVQRPKGERLGMCFFEGTPSWLSHKGNERTRLVLGISPMLKQIQTQLMDDGQAQGPVRRLSESVLRLPRQSSTLRATVQTQDLSLQCVLAIWMNASAIRTPGMPTRLGVILHTIE